MNLTRRTFVQFLGLLPLGAVLPWSGTEASPVYGVDLTRLRALELAKHATVKSQINLKYNGVAHFLNCDQLGLPGYSYAWMESHSNYVKSNGACRGRSFYGNAVGSGMKPHVVVDMIVRSWQKRAPDLA